MKSVTDISAFITQNAAYLTIPDMSFELDIPQHQIRSLCQKLSIVPIGIKEQTKQFILDHHNSKTLSEIAKLLGCGESNLRVHYNEMKIPYEIKKNGRHTKEETIREEPKKGPSVREILGGFQLTPAIHYHPPRLWDLF